VVLQVVQLVALCDAITLMLRQFASEDENLEAYFLCVSQLVIEWL
jgi:hypothetical protein